MVLRPFIEKKNCSLKMRTQHSIEFICRVSWWILIWLIFWYGRCCVSIYNSITLFYRFIWHRAVSFQFIKVILRCNEANTNNNKNPIKIDNTFDLIQLWKTTFFFLSHSLTSNTFYFSKTTFFLLLDLLFSFYSKKLKEKIEAFGSCYGAK